MEQVNNMFINKSTFLFMIFLKAQKNPHWAGLDEEDGLLRVHGPPKYVADYADFLVLHLLERVLLVGMLLSVEASQPDAGRQAVHLFDAKLSVVVNRIQLSIC